MFIHKTGEEMGVTGGIIGVLWSQGGNYTNTPGNSLAVSYTADIWHSVPSLKKLLVRGPSSVSVYNIYFKLLSLRL